MSPVAQLALPLLTTTACALPLRKRAWQTMTGAARVLLVVKVPAVTQGTSEAKIARSGIEAPDLMPQAVTPARKPCGAVTQLSISRNIFDTEKIPPDERNMRQDDRKGESLRSLWQFAGTQGFAAHLIVQCGRGWRQLTREPGKMLCEDTPLSVVLHFAARFPCIPPECVALATTRSLHAPDAKRGSYSDRQRTM